MGFLKGQNSFAFGKIKLGSSNINRIYFGSNYVWPPQEVSSCATEATCSYIAPIFSCATEAICSASIPVFSCATEGSCIIL